jgi:hypothetical protein
MYLDLCNPYTINSIGLALDIVGAWFVAWEVVGRYKGDKFKEVGGAKCGASPEDPQTDEYKKYEKNKGLFMWFGISLLTIGFGLQIYSNIIQNKESLVSIPAQAARPQTTFATKKPHINSLPVIAPKRPMASNGKKSIE